MKTPKEYRDNLLNHIITKQMLVDCLYSVNKRAKNYRDKEREQRADSGNLKITNLDRLFTLYKQSTSICLVIM